MKVLEIKITKETDSHYFFFIKIEKRTLFVRKVFTIECYREKDCLLSRRMSDSSGVYGLITGFDSLLDAVLSTEEKHYINKDSK